MLSEVLRAPLEGASPIEHDRAWINLPGHDGVLVDRSHVVPHDRVRKHVVRHSQDAQVAATVEGVQRPTGENLQGEPTASARQQAIERLGAAGRADEVVVKLLARAARDPAPGVRLAALKALAQASRNLDAALPQLLACSYDDTAAIREWSARTLGKIRPPPAPAIEELTRLAQDKDECVRLAAQSALGAIHGNVLTNVPAPPR